MVADRAETLTTSKEVIVTAATVKKFLTFEATVSTNDTITIQDLTTLLGAALMKRADGTACTCTIATNVITVTQAALTDAPVLGMAYGTP
jgi:hypothetical protein